MSIQGAFNFYKVCRLSKVVCGSKNRNFSKTWVYQIITRLIVELLYLIMKKYQGFFNFPNISEIHSVSMAKKINNLIKNFFDYCGKMQN